jgi:hypothetical protein
MKFIIRFFAWGFEKYTLPAWERELAEDLEEFEIIFEPDEGYVSMINRPDRERIH